MDLVHGHETHQRDVWHLFHVAAQVQGRLDRALKIEHDRLLLIQRQAAREASGKRGRGRPPKSTLSEQQALIAQMGYVAEGVRSLCQQLHTLLEVVVLHCGHVLSSEERQSQIEAVLDLLDEVVPLTTPALRGQIQMLSKHLRLALSQVLLFARQLDATQKHAEYLLGPEAVALLAWAWIRRAVLGPTSNDLLQSVPSDWQAEAFNLLSAWDQAVRASSVVENWHSIVSGLIWPFIASFRLACWHCWRFGIITGLLLVVSMQVCPPYNGRDHHHPRKFGWQLWAILLLQPKCSNMSHGFEPCLKRFSLTRPPGLPGNWPGLPIVVSSRPTTPRTMGI